MQETKLPVQVWLARFTCKLISVPFVCTGLFNEDFWSRLSCLWQCTVVPARNQKTGRRRKGVRREGKGGQTTATGWRHDPPPISHRTLDRVRSVLASSHINGTVPSHLDTRHNFSFYVNTRKHNVRH